MADNVLKSRLRLRYDTFANWSKSLEGAGANLILAVGEMGVCYVPATDATSASILFKVGDGTHTFAQLPWASGLAADVYDWAKESHAPIYADTTEYWTTNKHFIGNKGDIVVYTDYKQVSWETEEGTATKNVPGIKVLDGSAYVVDQPFVTTWVEKQIEDHISDAVAHITAAERTKWNNKVNVEDEVVGEVLVMNRN